MKIVGQQRVEQVRPAGKRGQLTLGGARHPARVAQVPLPLLADLAGQYGIRKQIPVAAPHLLARRQVGAVGVGLLDAQAALVGRAADGVGIVAVSGLNALLVEPAVALTQAGITF
ncbi:hypothetical protein [Hymenobacter metallicola]|nr:hypothetical protein [Hymenobacter metallicola]